MMIRIEHLHWNTAAEKARCEAFVEFIDESGLVPMFPNWGMAPWHLQCVVTSPKTGEQCTVNFWPHKACARAEGCSAWSTPNNPRKAYESAVAEAFEKVHNV